MKSKLENTDRKLLELLLGKPRTIAELIDELGVTATAVRQRIDRLAGWGYIHREEHRAGRGRPLHKYSLSPVGQKALGNNLTELAVALWEELQALDDPALRSKILNGVAKRLVAQWGGPLRGDSISGRMQNLTNALRDQEMSVQLEPSSEGELPILKFSGCPYPDLSEINHDICELETAVLSSLLGQPVTLTSCRCDSASGACIYELQPLVG
ncbi:MAG TPA: MarR family transcriptional regulator [Pirellulaceae bacterium]|nr:MarR family transcriptional regulator [Pirellulaceae bacterium]